MLMRSGDCLPTACRRRLFQGQFIKVSSVSRQVKEELRVQFPLWLKRNCVFPGTSMCGRGCRDFIKHFLNCTSEMPVNFFYKGQLMVPICSPCSYFSMQLLWKIDFTLRLLLEASLLLVELLQIHCH